MKIGILTYHSVPNFGAQLQCLSTVGFIKRCGHDPLVLNWYPKDLEEMYLSRIPIEQVLIHNSFTKNCLPVTKECINESELIKEIEKHQIEAIIVGGDALFKYLPLEKRMRMMLRGENITSVEKLKGNPFFGGFLSHFGGTIKAAAFSVSSQNSPYKTMLSFEKSAMRHALSHFNTIYVRDEWTKNMIESITKNKVKITPDPVFSFNQNCHHLIPSSEEIQTKYDIPKKYILLSFSDKYVSNAYISSLIAGVKSVGAEPILLPMPEGHFFDSDEIKRINIPLNPIEWYALIKYSKGYIGERMHPIVVCIHNSIPFFCFDEYGIIKKSLLNERTYIKESSKTYSITKKAGLEENLFSYHQETEFPQVREILDKLLNFDSIRCSSFAKRYQAEYNIAMNEILESFKK